MKATAFGFEAMLLRWHNSSSGGPQVILALADEDDLLPFQSMTQAKGKRAGQRMMVAVSLIDDQEQPEPVPEPQPAPRPERQSGSGKNWHGYPPGLAGLAVRWSQDPEFRVWLGEKVGESPEGEEWAKSVVCGMCGITSRKDLDRDQVAGAVFRAEFLEPYKEYMASKVGR